MTTVTESDIKEIKDLINTRFDKLQEDLTEIKVKLATLEAKIGGLETRMLGVESRVTGQTNWFISLFAVLTAGLLGILGKIALFPTV